MPPGVPVATVAVNGAQNAAILAVQMLALSDERLAEAMASYKERLVEQVEAKDARAQKRLQSEGLL
jgi:5-(carboxyamino)imidazole ribonucleotide mutase